MQINELLNEYGESHQNKWNIIIHKVCVPLIMLSIIGLLMSIPWPWEQVPLIYILFIPVLIYYLYLSLKHSLVVIPIYLLMIFVNYQIQQFISLFQVSLIIFVLSWIGQFIGHKIEGKKPSFFKDLQFLLIGPIWVIFGNHPKS